MLGMHSGVLFSHKEEKTNAGQGVAKQEPLYTAGGNAS
jgi:hypothetical protein